MATLTPFRYPGSKNKMLPILSEYLDKAMVSWNCFTDVFVGGGSVLLDMAARYPKIQLYANDKDFNIASFWNTVSDPDINKLNGLLDLMAQPVTLELFYKLQGSQPNDEIEAAYRAIFLNRTAFSGIAKSGPIGGKEQRSKYTVDCRYNFKKLKSKILNCHKLLAGRTTIENCDIALYKPFTDTNMPAYLDPPYYIKGASLYPINMVPMEHIYMSVLLQKRDNWVLSYDDCPEIRNLYLKQNVIDLAARYCINGKKSTWENKNELIITP